MGVVVNPNVTAPNHSTVITLLRFAYKLRNATYRRIMGSGAEHIRECPYCHAPELEDRDQLAHCRRCGLNFPAAAS